MLTEESVLSLLSKIEGTRADENDAIVFDYQFRSLFQDLSSHADIIKISKGYEILRQSEDYYRFALPLVIFMVKGHNSKDEIDALMEYVKNNTIYETDIRNHRLNLRQLLSNIAAALDENDIRELVTVISRRLDIDMDFIKDDKDYSLATALKAFQLLEEKGEFKSMLENHQKDISKFMPLNMLLEEMGQSRMIKDYVEPYSPQPITVAVMNVQRLIQRDLQPQDTGQALSAYKDCVKAAYDLMSVIETNQWPPVTNHFYINLALITSQFMPHGDTFSRATIRGSVDDVYKKKEPIEFDQVFPTKITSEKHYVTMIEGRPGCGKSTLITKVGKDWAEGEILTDIEIFVLVRLRRFVNKKDLNLKDILGVYCDNPDIVEAVHDKITRSSGKGVCFAFDGLDEYSSKLTANNILMKLIHGHLLPHAIIFLTTRPATSARFKTRGILAQNIEIIGFLQKEIDEYIQSSYQDKPEKACELNKYIKDHPNITRMCYLPLHIAMVVFLYDHDPDCNFLPRSETDLYIKFTLHTLQRSFRREPDEDFDPVDIRMSGFGDLPEQKKAIFHQVCKLAFYATVNQKQLLTGREIKKNAALPNVPKKQQFESLGLLTVDRMITDSSLPTKTFSFLHLTHQEFLSAVFLIYHQSVNEQLAIIQEFADKVHMWVVWKFFCGLYADESLDKSGIFPKAFSSIIAENVSTRLGCLNMIHCAFESQRPAACSDLLTLLKGIINIMDIAVNPSDCSALGYVFANAPKCLKEIDFSYCHLGPEGMAAFVKQLEKLHGSLQEVELLRLRARTDYKPVGSQGAPDLVKLLKKLPNLGELRLYGNKLKTEMFQSLAPAIAELKMIHTLILSRNDIEVDAGPMVSDVLGNLPLLHTFYISYNPLTERGLSSMIPGLFKCKELKILGLRGTHLSEGAGVHLREILNTLANLEIIELYQNKLGDKGVCDMVPGLLQAKSLKKLSLVENGITDIGALALVSYLSVTSTLEEMRIYYNHAMTDVGKIALRTAVVERPSNLCYLGLAV